MKFKFIIFSFFFVCVLNSFANENNDKSTTDTLKITPADTLNLKDTIKTVIADLNAVEVTADIAPPESQERKGFHVLWVIIAILLLLIFLGYTYRHKD
jgi:hypothetical protein